MNVHGSATNLHVLRDAGCERTNSLITAMPSDADNITCALIGRSLGAARILGRVRDSSYAAAYEVASVDHLIRATHILRNQVVLHVEHPQVEEIVTLGDDTAQIFSLRVREDGWCAGRLVSDIAADRRFPSECLLVGLRRARTRKLEIPHGGDAGRGRRLDPGDRRRRGHRARGRAARPSGLRWPARWPPSPAHADEAQPATRRAESTAGSPSRRPSARTICVA